MVKKLRHTQGFTLIELIAVIVLLGIIASVGIPKFVDLQSAANTAKVKDLEGKLITTRTQAFAACQVTPACVEHGRGQVVFLPPLNSNVQLIEQYPDAGEIDRSDQIDDLIDVSGFTITGENGRFTARWSIPGKVNCYAQYTQSTTTNLIPLVESVTTGC